jgi:hypothetical protein
VRPALSIERNYKYPQPSMRIHVHVSTQLPTQPAVLVQPNPLPKSVPRDVRPRDQPSHLPRGLQRWLPSRLSSRFPAVVNASRYQYQCRTGSQPAVERSTADNCADRSAETVGVVKAEAEEKGEEGSGERCRHVRPAYTQAPDRGER